MPAMQLIKRQLVEIFFSEMRVKSGNKDEVLEALKNNQHARQCIELLGVANDADVTATFDSCTYRIFQCTTSGCHEMLLKKKQAGQRLSCLGCKQKEENHARSERTKV